MKKFVTLLLVLCLLTSIATIGSADETKPQNLTVITVPSTSGGYAFWVAFAKAVQDDIPQYNVTLTESTGALDISNRMREGEGDLGNASSDIVYMGWNGTGKFEGEADQNMRILFSYDNHVLQWFANETQGITNIEQLDGKNYNPGGSGTSAATATQDIFDLLGIKPNFYSAAQAAAGEAYQNREIVGSCKLGAAPDSWINQLHAVVPLNMISLTEDQQKKICEAFPYFSPGIIPADVYYDGQPEIVTVGNLMSVQTTPELSQEVGYNIVKAFFNNWDVISDSKPSMKAYDTIDLTLTQIYPLAAGTVQYLVEMGYEVPEALIPAEYVPVN